MKYMYYIYVSKKKFLDENYRKKVIEFKSCSTSDIP